MTPEEMNRNYQNQVIVKNKYLAKPVPEEEEEELKEHEKPKASVGPFISYLNTNGLNFNAVHNHIRSHSVGGTMLDHKKLAAYLKNDLRASDAPDLSTLNIQEVAEINIMSENDLQESIAGSQFEQEIQQHLLMNPMNF